MGISDLPVCSPFDFLCQVARRAAKAGVYSEWAQDHLVQVWNNCYIISLPQAQPEQIQAQYFRDPAQLLLYMSTGSFLADINNEVLLPSSRKETYAENLVSLHNLVLVLFAEDKTVVPKESAWFGSEAPPEQVALLSQSILDSHPDQEPLDHALRIQEKNIVPMELQPLYTEDWIGLRTLDERGAVVFATCPGEHMQLTGCWEDLVGTWIGSAF
jgi:palmitoyl-protein thioesterase